MGGKNIVNLYDPSVRTWERWIRFLSVLSITINDPRVNRFPFLLVFYPSSQTKESIPGFGLETERFRKESLVKLGSNDSFCCVGSTNSFKELSIPKNIREGATKQTFKVGRSIDIAVVSETLFSVGYKKCNTTTDPGTYSLRGDVLDVFPYHFRNPFRFSFNFDKIERTSFLRIFILNI